MSHWWIVIIFRIFKKKEKKLIESIMSVFKEIQLPWRIALICFVSLNFVWLHGILYRITNYKFTATVVGLSAISVAIKKILNNDILVMFNLIYYDACNDLLSRWNQFNTPSTQNAITIIAILQFRPQYPTLFTLIFVTVLLFT